MSIFLNNYYFFAIQNSTPKLGLKTTTVIFQDSRVGDLGSHAGDHSHFHSHLLGEGSRWPHSHFWLMVWLCLGSAPRGPSLSVNLD